MNLIEDFTATLRIQNCEMEKQLRKIRIKKKLLAMPWLIFLCPLDDCRFFCNSEGYINNLAATHLKRVHNLDSATVAKNVSKYRFRLVDPNSDDHHALLGVPKNSSKEFIRKTYYRLAKIYHTDKQQNKDRLYIAEMEERFKRLVTAYKALTETSDWSYRWLHNFILLRFTLYSFIVYKNKIKV